MTKEDKQKNYCVFFSGGTCDNEELFNGSTEVSSGYCKKCLYYKKGEVMKKETYTLTLNLTCSNGKYRKMFNLGKYTDFLHAKRLQIVIKDIFESVKRLHKGQNNDKQ